MHDTVLRRAAVLWLRGFLLTSLICALVLPLSRRFGSVSVWAVVPRGSGDLSEALRFRILRLVPCALYCGGTVLAGSTVFCRSVLRALCVLRGTALGLAFGMLADGRLFLPAPSRTLFFALLELAFWLAEGAAVGIRSDELFAGYAGGDSVRFRSALGAGLSSALILSGCAFLASAAGMPGSLF